MTYRRLISKFEYADNMVQKQRLFPKLLPTLVSKTRQEHFFSLISECMDTLDDTNRAGLARRLLTEGFCPEYGSNLYYIVFKPVLDEMFPNDALLSSRSVWLAPVSKHGPGPVLQYWLPFERSMLSYLEFSESTLHSKIAIGRPENLTPILRILFHDTRALLLILQGLNRVSDSTNVSFTDDLTEASFVSRHNNDKAVANISCMGIQHKSMVENLDITLNLAHWKRITQPWKGVPLSLCFLELFKIGNDWHLWFYMESLTSLLSVRLEHFSVGFDRQIRAVEGAKAVDYPFMGHFPIVDLRRTMKSISNFTKKNTNTDSAIQIRTDGILNKIYLTNYKGASERVLMEWVAPFAQVANSSPKIYKRDFYKLLLGTRGKLVKLVWGLEDTVSAVLDVASKYVWLKSHSASLIYIINPTEKARRLDELQKTEAMGRILEDYMKIQRRLYQAGLRDTYVAGSRDKFNKWEKWRKDPKRGNLVVDSSERFPGFVRMWEWIYMKRLPPGRQAGYLLTRGGAKEFQCLLHDCAPLRSKAQLYEWKLWAREFLYALHVYVRERHSLSFDFAKVPVEKFRLPLRFPQCSTRGSLAEVLARLSVLAH